MVKVKTDRGTYFLQTNCDIPIDGNIIEVVDENNELKNWKKEELSDATDLYFYSQAKRRGGYLNMGEINFDADVENDPDAKFLQKLYKALWEREVELEEQIDKMSLEELLNLDIEKLTKTEYDKVLKELEASSSESSNSDNQEGSTNE